jgi:hypothetical protein
MFVLDNQKFLDQILKAWVNHGITGATIIESTGAFRHLNEHIPMRYSYGATTDVELGNITIFVIVENQDEIQLCLELIENIVGDLDDPNTGIFAAWHLSSIKGFQTH